MKTIGGPLNRTKPRRHSRPVRAARPQLLLPEHGDELTVLRIFSPEAHAVFVAGTFNDWDPAATPLEADSFGNWRVALRLEPGQHEYRFVVDGSWVTDPLAAQLKSNPFGDFNGVINVTAPRHTN